MGNMVNVVKGKRTSKYYGVRIDKRKKGEIVREYYRSDIEAENRKYYLGSYLSEEFAAYAFNVGFDFLKNGKYTIENHVEISDEEKEFVFNKVKTFMKKRGISS